MKTNKNTFKKIDAIQEKLDFYAEKKVYLVQSDIIDVSRFVNGSLNTDKTIDMTVKEAIKNNQWDTCKGTMGYVISITDNIDKYQVYFDGRRCFVKLNGGTPY